MIALERFLIGLDGWPWSAVSRVALGFGIPIVFRSLPGDGQSLRLSLIFFIGLLAAVRIIPTLMRRLLPFSPQAKEAWAERRGIAKRYDSYQWQKLFWIGLGLLFYAAIGGGLRSGELLIASVCLIGGGAGLWFWWQAGHAKIAK